MNAIEIILLLFGFISICVSFFVGNRQKEEKQEEVQEPESRSIWTAKEEKMIQDRIRSILEKETEDIVAGAVNELNQKSNQKIMEFDEFSSQLLEKINHNHEEVVFMYSMLTDKEKEWKNEVKKAAVREAAEREKEASEEKKVEKPDKQQAADSQVPERQEPGRRQAEKTASEKRVSQRPSAEVRTEERPAPGNKVAGRPESVRTVSDKRTPSSGTEEKKPAKQYTESPVHDGPGASDRVIQMYKSGKSVLEISKEMDMGQGEVKLMIALYGGKA